MTSSVYGTNWYTYYSNDYNQFLMVSYINNHVNALYTNQNLISSKSQIKYDTPKDVVRKDMGPDSSYKKGKVGFDVKVMNMMFSIKTIFIPQYFMISTEIMV